MGGAGCGLGYRVRGGGRGMRAGVRMVIVNVWRGGEGGSVVWNCGGEGESGQRADVSVSLCWGHGGAVLDGRYEAAGASLRRGG